jgi:hypothetical protein
MCRSIVSCKAQVIVLSLVLREDNPLSGEFLYLPARSSFGRKTTETGENGLQAVPFKIQK